MLHHEPVATFTWANEPRRAQRRSSFEETHMGDELCDDLISEDLQTLD